jgi:hypothetical protein
VYERVGQLFRDRFGDKAGWAHSLLFAAELPTYRVRGRGRWRRVFQEAWDHQEKTESGTD